MSTTFLTWASGVDVDVGMIILPTTPNDFWYLVETAGTTGGTEPTFSTAVNGSTTDNTATLRTRRAFTLSIESSGGDYNTLSGAESANQPDLVTALVFDHGGITGLIADGAAVAQVTSGATGTVTHVTAAQVLIHTITGTFNGADQIYETISVNYVTPTSAGHHAMIDFKCGNFALNDDIGIIGAVIDSTHYSIISTTDAGHCRGISRDVSGTGFQIYSNTAGVVRIAAEFFAMTGVGIKNTAAAASINMPVAIAAGGRVVIDSFVAQNANISSTTYNVRPNRANANVFLTNFVAYGGSRQIDTRSCASATLRHGSFYSTTDQLVVVCSSEATINNVYAGKSAGSSAQDFWTGGAAPAGSNNISSDATATIDFTDSLINRTAVDQFVSAAFATADFHLIAGSDCEGAGTPFLQIPLDIDGDLRGLIVTDVGADEFVASGSVDLTIQNSAHIHTADNAVLTQDHQLALQDSAHTHNANNIALTQDHQLSVQDSDHAHAADNITLTQLHILTVADSAHAHATDNLTLTQDQFLTIQESLHSLVSDNVILTQDHNILIQDADHGHTADNIALTQDHQLLVNESTHAHNADNIALSVDGSLIIAESTHSHFAENINPTQDHQLVLQDSAHTHTSDNIVLTQDHQLSVQDSDHAHAADNITLSTAVILTIADALHAHAVDNIALTQDHQLIIQDALHSHLADAITLTQDHQLIISESLHTLISDNITLTVPSIAITPKSRIFAILNEDRIILIAKDDRIFNILN